MQGPATPLRVERPRGLAAAGSIPQMYSPQGCGCRNAGGLHPTAAVVQVFVGTVAVRAECVDEQQHELRPAWGAAVLGGYVTNSVVCRRTATGNAGVPEPRRWARWGCQGPGGPRR